MGKIITALLADGSTLDVATFSMKRAQLFYDLTKLLEEHYLHIPSGLQADQGIDEHRLDAEQFQLFFQEFWDIGWLGEKRGGFLYNWARYAAGIIENITHEPRDWIDRKGETLEVIRYRRFDENVGG